MKQLFTITLVLGLSVVAIQAQMVMYEDFESYATDSNIHLQGTDTTAAWGEVPRWYCQDNTSLLVDHEHSIVRTVGENNYLEMEATGRAGGLTTTGTAMSMESVAITGLGTIYMRWAVNDVSRNMLCTNSLEPGWDYDSNALVEPGTINADGWQEGFSGEGYAKMGALFQQGGGNPFGARDGAAGYVDDPNIQLPIETWMELWIQVDAANDRTKYFVCEQGGTPVQALTPGGGEWWGMRNEGFDNNGVENLKWIPSNWGQTDEISNTIYVDTIGIDSGAMTLDRVGEDVASIWVAAIPGDLDGDGDVDLDDFVILKNAFGIDAGGDIDGDGDTDLDDFVLLKNNFGT